MSVLLHIKGITLTHLSAEPKLKEAVLDVINCIDKDLDANDFNDVISDETETAIQNLDKVLCDFTEIPDVEVERDEVISNKSLLEVDDDDTTFDPK